MNPIEKLKAEHRDIESALELLTDVTGKLEFDRSYLDVMDQLVIFLRKYADTYHHGKEEKLLFTAMTEAGFPVNNGPIGVMLKEHDQGRNYVRGLVQAVEEYKQGNAGAIENIKENAANYRSLLEQHIQKEDNVLYVMADKRLNSERKQNLILKFEQFEQANGSTGNELCQILYKLKAEISI